MKKQMREQTEKALQNASVALFLIDARDGVTLEDEFFAKWLKKSVNIPVILIANKTEALMVPPSSCSPPTSILFVVWSVL